MTTPSQDTVQPAPDTPKRRRSILGRILKWLMWIVAGLLAVPVVLLAVGVVSNLIDPPGLSESSEPVRFRFLDRSFAIPKHYQPSRFAHEDEDQPHTVNVEALFPDFAPYSKARRADWFDVRHGSLMVTIITTSARTAIRPGELARSQLEFAIDKSGQPGPAGLRRYDMQDNPRAVYQVVYVPEQPSSVDYIGCYVVKGAMTGCWMKAIYDDVARQNIIFDSEFLPDWRRIVDTSHRLLKSFETPSN